MLNGRESQMKLWDEIADKLCSLAGESSGLSKKRNKTFIVLERKLGKSELNKNAVSLKREGVSFMSSDWKTAAAQARSRRFSVGQDQDFPQRLIFHDLELSKVASFSDFFSGLTKEAALHSEYLQSAGRHEKS
jgi:hypothetical protein